MSKRSKPQQQRLPVIDAPKRIKVLAIGPATVGKSCLIKRYCEERQRVNTSRRLGLTMA